MPARLIPVLLIDRNKRLIKTVRFGERTYIGDPFNVIRIFNEKEVDEICLLDIDASVDGRTPDLGFVRELASECFMPLGYGGGIASLQDARALFQSGIEKIIIGSQAHDGKLIESSSKDFGSQAVVASVDVTRSGSEWEVRTYSGRKVVDRNPSDYAQRMVLAGAGEILLHHIDNDGMRLGYDFGLIKRISSSLPVPLIALGGAGEHAHLHQCLTAGADAAASGSAFIFLGQLRAVLVTYPSQQDIQTTISPLDNPS